MPQSEREESCSLVLDGKEDGGERTGCPPRISMTKEEGRGSESNSKNLT